MNITELLKDKGGVILLYYGKNDMASGYQIKTLFDNYDDINNYFQNRRPIVETVDDYVDYIFIDSFSQLKEVVPMVREDIKIKVGSLIDSIIEIKKEYKESEINKYIKENYEVLLSKDKMEKFDLRAHEIIEYTLNYIKSHFQVFTKKIKIYKYIIEKYAYKVFYDFDEYRDIFMLFPELNELLFSEKIIKEQMSGRVEELREPLKMIKKNNVELYKNSINTIDDMVKERAFHTDLEKVLYTYEDLRKTIKLFDVLGESKLSDDYKKELKKQEIVLNKYLQEKGTCSRYEINVAELDNAFKKTKMTWEMKSLLITHTKNDNNKLYSRIQFAIEDKKTISLVDKIVSTNYDTNDYFTFSVQNRLSLTMLLGKFLIDYMLSDNERFNDLINYIFGGVVNYIEKNGIVIPNIEDDFNMLNFSLKNTIIENKKYDRDGLSCEYWNYNTLHLSIGIIEKILREMAYNILIVNQYTARNVLNLEKILQLKETEEFLGQANTRALRFYLTNYEKVGNNLRNDICHYNNNIKEICTYDSVLEIIYLLLTITNELLVKVIYKK